MSARTYAWRYLIIGDVKYYGKRRELLAMLRAIATRMVGHDGETCQECGRRYISWCAPTWLYVERKGDNHGQFCLSCFDSLGEPLLWVPQPWSWETVNELWDKETA
jgi:hypothetical protein